MRAVGCRITKRIGIGSSVKRIREWEFTSLEFWSSMGTAVWPED
jgi:hypothetical protein